MKSYVSDAARFCLMQLQLPITIGDVTTLQTADILLHDAQFEATGLEFDRQAKKFLLAAWLPAWDQARDTKLCCCLYKRRVPLGRLDLVFNAVTECHIGI